MYTVLFLTTAVRLVDLIYILAQDATRLPVPVLVVTTAMILYGVVIVVRKLTGNILLRQLMLFYMTQLVMIVFNLTYVIVAYPLQVNFAETMIIGTFLDLILGVTFLFLCAKQFRSSYISVPVAPARKGQMNA